MLYIEGDKRTVPSTFLTKQEHIKDLREPENWDTVSAADNEEEFEAKFKMIDERKRDDLGWFEKNRYFQNIFPSMKIQKPGYALYGTEAFIMGIILAINVACFS